MFQDEKGMGMNSKRDVGNKNGLTASPIRGRQSHAHQ